MFTPVIPATGCRITCCPGGRAEAGRIVSAPETGGATAFGTRPGLRNDEGFGAAGLGRAEDSVRLTPLGDLGITGNRGMGILNAVLFWFAWLTKQDKEKVVYRCVITNKSQCCHLLVILFSVSRNSFKKSFHIVFTKNKKVYSMCD